MTSSGWGIFKRSQSPPVLTNYRAYKPFLQVDFLHRCSYCRITEHRWGSERNFVVEHFRPKSRKLFVRLICKYSNLYYACNRCNDFKGDTWPNAALRSSGYYFADPCVDDVYNHHLRIRNTGQLEALTNCGEYTRDHLRLNRTTLVIWRRERRKLLEDIKVTRKAVRSLQKRMRPRLTVRAKREFDELISRHLALCDWLAREY